MKIIKELSINQKHTVQLWLGVGLAVMGVVLFIMGFYAVPVGDIANSVLVAGGEIFTFSGSLLGLDYFYKSKAFTKKIDYMIEQDNAKADRSEE